MWNGCKVIKDQSSEQPFIHKPSQFQHQPVQQRPVIAKVRNVGHAFRIHVSHVSQEDVVYARVTQSRDVTGHVTGHVGGCRSADVAQISGWLPYYRTIRRLHVKMYMFKTVVSLLSGHSTLSSGMGLAIPVYRRPPQSALATSSPFYLNISFLYALIE
jgi:hypothetical protein